ncbi:hypothetical protein AVEN_114263-1 [Araneus ventricosus]|uniref:Uncharacterized protein n=1 Tax=Araneus ventricosus TaxID=182803 RepID=A0A4Y2MFN6_ARAVE|nr:hypothetical protein AVEN_114263-1 [Araneus ventricosus]
MTIDELAQEVGISHGSIHATLSDDLKMKRVIAVCPAAAEPGSNGTGDPTFLETIITGDEIWVYAYDTETKMQSSEWHTTSSPRPKKSRHVKSEK